MIRKAFILLSCLWGIPLFLSAQQIRIDDFARLKKPLLGAKQYSTDKQFALLDLYTQESGFQFFIGKQAVEAQENDGFMTLALPDKTRFFTVKHPEYGQVIWKAPEELRRKKHYQASLFTDSPGKEYQIEKQWAIFYVQPEQAMVTIDSTLYRTMDGSVQAYLPLGEHAVRVESPFYEAWEDTVCIGKERRLEKQIHLQPLYSFLAVDSHIPYAEIWLDGQLMGVQTAQSKRLLPGTYQLTIQKDSFLLYQEEVTLAVAERKVIDLKSRLGYRQMNAMKVSSSEVALAEPTAVDPVFQPTVKPQPVMRPDSLYVQAFDEDTEIWVNREKVAQGSWKEELPPGVHAVSTRKDGMESRTQYIRIGDGEGVRLRMAAPSANYGWLNVACNVVDADVWLDGQWAGKTPCILSGLSVNKSYAVKITKEGYKDAGTTVTLKGNEMKSVTLKLKNK